MGKIFATMLLPASSAFIIPRRSRGGYSFGVVQRSHVAYQIKADDAGSNMVANILITDTPLTQGMGSN